MKKILLLICLFGAAILNAQVIYVDWDAPGSGNNGSSWNNAYYDLQQAINDAVSGEEIWVAKGTYLPTQDTSGSVPFGAAARNKVFYVVNKDLKIYGGFAGNENALGERNTALNRTILSGELGDTAIVIDNAKTVLYILGNGTEVELDGIDIANAYAADGNLQFSVAHAGAILAVNSGNNSDSSVLRLNDVNLYNNTALYRGGAITTLSFYVHANRTNFYDNAASESAGAVYIQNTFGNNANEFTRCKFYRNKSGYGGALKIDGGNPSFPNIIQNSIFYNNEATAAGGALQFYSTTVHIDNSTFYNNIAPNPNPNAEGGSTVFNVDINQVKFTNCILWAGNAAIRENSAIIGLNRTKAYYSIVNGGFNVGSNNLNREPKFTDWVNGDFSPLSCSPSVDAGVNDSVPSGITDFKGGSRIVSGKVDMGAIEYVPYTVVANPTTITVSGLNNTTYEWINCNTNQVITNETNASFTPAVSGNYKVVITQGYVQLGACVDTSDCFNIQLQGVGINDIGQNGIRFAMYPNPALNVLNIEIESNNINRLSQIQVNDMQGRIVMSSTFEEKTTLDVSKLAATTYQVKISNGTSTAVKRFVKL